jgi:thioredoxin-related protein
MPIKLMWVFVFAIMVSATNLRADEVSAARNSSSESAIETAETPLLAIEQIYREWLVAQDAQKPLMLVLGEGDCDRCALLGRYMEDAAMRARIEQRFAILRIDLAHSDLALAVEQGASGEHPLPAIILVETAQPFADVWQPERLMAFLPEPYEPIYQWIENVMQYSDSRLAAL